MLIIINNDNQISAYLISQTDGTTDSDTINNRPFVSNIIWNKSFLGSNEI